MKLILYEVCTCRNRIGHKQREIEEELIRLKNQGIDEREAENEVIKKFNLDKMCCRRTYLCNSRNAFIKNSNRDAYIDCVGIDQTRRLRECKKNDGIHFSPSPELPPLPPKRVY
jgi:DNA-directed RNA polymerase subunit N (RpoN/RPB10)